MRINFEVAFRRGVGLLAFAALVSGGCTGGPSYEALFDTSPEAEGTGIFGVGLVRAVVILATYDATEQQRQVAEQRARLAHAKLLVAERKTPTRGERGAQTTAKKKPAKKRARYLAVDTARDSRSKGKRSVMIWDTQSQEIVGNNVYDVAEPPPVLETGRFETYSAQYVAAAGF